MYTATGPGKIEVLFEAVGAGVLEARLYDFDFDDFAGRIFRPLKPLHAKFLLERVIPLLKNFKGNIWLQGSASRIGPKNWNIELSQVRESSVQALLLTNGIDPEQIEAHAVGNTLTVTHALDDSHDRCVLLWVRPRYDFRPSLPTKVPPRPRLSSTFKIAVDGQYPAVWMPHHQKISIADQLLELSVPAANLSATDLPFIVWDTTNNIACRYLFNDIDFGFDQTLLDSDLPKPHGPWNIFITSKPIGCWQFGRDARLTVAGGYNIFYNRLHIETPDGVKNIDMQLDTGITTFGPKGSTTLLGDFARMEGPVRFSGP